MYQCTNAADSFDDWFEQLQTIAKRRGFDLTAADREDWRNYYDESYTPKGALDADDAHA